MNISSVVKQVFGKLKVVGSDGTVIGNVGDALKISGTFTATTNEGIVDSGNSSTVALGANATFTGSSIEIKNYAAINVAAFSDVSSATDGLKMQFSPDGTNWDHEHTFSVTGNIGVSYAQAAELRYFRIVYVNGATPQSLFRLTTILKATTVSPSRYTVGQTLTGGQMADVTKSVIWGLSSSGGGTYVAAKVTPSGSLTTAIGDITGVVGQSTMANSLPVAIASNQSAIPVSQSGTWNINNVSGTVSLPTGAATSAKQPALGTAGTPSSDVLTVQGIASMTALKVDGSAVTQPVSGTVIANAGTGSFVVAQPTAANLNASVVQSGTWDINNISGTISLPTGAATESTSLAISGKLPATLGQKTSANSLAVTVASDQSAIPASQSGTWNINNISGTISLPSGAATETTSLAISGKLPATLGQKTMTNSLAVTMASDQTAIPASQSGTWNINNITGTVSLPTGAATETTSLAISGKLPATLGQKTMANALAVSIASDQSNIPILLKDESGNAYSATNPLQVVVIESEGSEINNYQTSASLASNSSVDLDYTVTALKTLKLSQFQFSASGKAKFELKIETAVGSGTFSTKFVFFNSTANPNVDFALKEHIDVAAGVKVRVTITNKDVQAQDVYSTICGHEV